MSIGLPNTGYLVNGVRMPEGDDWVITMPSHGYGTEETVRQLSHCITATRAEFADSPRVMLGSLSAATGGKLSPHKSHRTGRDADVYFFRKPGAQWSKAATPQDIDLPRTWSLLRCFVTEADVDMVLIDRRVQGWLKHYAVSIGEPPEWIDQLFNDRPHTKSAIVRHVPGHIAHMHVRFVSAHARHLGVKNYKALVGAGLLKERVEEVRHTVAKGDTLLGLAKRYTLPVGEIASLNKLQGTVIRLGQVLLVKQGKPIEGVDAPIYGHARVLPPEPCEPGPKACHAGLALVNRSYVGALVGEPAPEDAALLSASLR
jgi:LysM repeat protein